MRRVGAAWEEGRRESTRVRSRRCISAACAAVPSDGRVMAEEREGHARRLLGKGPAPAPLRARVNGTLRERARSTSQVCNGAVENPSCALPSSSPGTSDLGRNSLRAPSKVAALATLYDAPAQVVPSTLHTTTVSHTRWSRVSSALATGDGFSAATNHRRAASSPPRTFCRPLQPVRRPLFLT